MSIHVGAIGTRSKVEVGVLSRPQARTLRRRRRRRGVGWKWDRTQSGGVHPGTHLDGFPPDEGGGGRGAVGAGVIEGEDVFGKVEASGAAAEEEYGSIVGSCGGEGGGVGAEPDARPLVGLPDLGHPLTPLPHPHAPVLPPHADSP